LFCLLGRYVGNAPVIANTAQFKKPVQVLALLFAEFACLDEPLVDRCDDSAMLAQTNTFA